jgi:hypothetical protein
MKQKAPRLYGRPVYINALSFPDMIECLPSARINILINIIKIVDGIKYHISASFVLFGKCIYSFLLFNIFYIYFFLTIKTPGPSLFYTIDKLFCPVAATYLKVNHLPYQLLYLHQTLKQTDERF